MSERASTPEQGGPLLASAEGEPQSAGRAVPAAGERQAAGDEAIERLERELTETRRALADAEQRLHELRDRRSTTMARLERQAYWLERWGIDLDRWMRLPVVRLPFLVLRVVVRLRRRFVRWRRG